MHRLLQDNKSCDWKSTTTLQVQNQTNSAVLILGSCIVSDGQTANVQMLNQKSKNKWLINVKTTTTLFFTFFNALR